MAISSSDPVAGTDKLFLGIDVGGTNVKVGLVDRDGRLHAKESAATPELRTPQRVIDFAVDFGRRGARSIGRCESDLAAVGLAVPGVLDTAAYELREVVNLPGWVNKPLLEILSQSSSLPSAVVNDANSAAFAEHALRGLKSQSLALVTLGTGIGCGLVVDGAPFSGDHGCAGELGHIPVRFGPDAVPCTCGSRGHLESYAGAAGVINRLESLLKEVDQGTIPATLCSDTVSPKEIAEAAAKGFPPAIAVLEETGQLVGQAIGMLGQVFDPAVVLLGGAMTFGGKGTTTGDLFRQNVRDAVKETTLVQVGGNMVIDFATLGNDAGVLGAAMVSVQMSET